MNWNTYKTLTSELKEEYDWKFKNKGKFESRGILVNATSLMFIIISMLFTFYIIVKDPELISYQGEVIDLLTGVAKVIDIALIIIVVHAIIMFITIIYYNVLQYKWMKTNNIKRKWKWWK